MDSSVAVKEKGSDLSIGESMDELALFMVDKLDVVDIPLKHSFTPRLYIREMFAPKNTLIVGKVHLTEDPFALMYGSKMMFTEDGGEVTLYAGHTGVTTPGTRRVGYILEDCHWINYHVLTDREEKLRLDGLNTDDLVEIIEERIFEQLEPVPGRDGKTIEDIYKERLKGVLECQQ